MRFTAALADSTKRSGVRLMVSSLLASAAIAFVPAAGASRTAWAQEASQSATKDERTVPDTLNFANALLRDRKYELAAEEYEKFLGQTTEGPHADDARYGLATARLFLGQNSVAREQFEAFLKAAPTHANAGTAWFRVGETSYMLGDLPAARQALETYTKNFPKHRQLETAWPYLGDVCFRLGALPEARQAYEQALSQYPDGRLADRARYGLARALASLEERDQAIELFTNLAARGGREWVDKARYQLGVVLSAAGRQADAVTAFEELERSAPKSPLVSEARLRRAEALAQLGRRDEAEALLGPLAAAEGGIAPQAAFALGNLRWDAGAVPEAIGIWQDAVKRFPTSAMAPALYFRLAEGLAVQGRPEDARGLFLKVAAAYPKDAWAGDALLRASELALKAKDTAAVREATAQLAARFPESPLLASAHLVEAQAALADGKPKLAIPLLTHLLDEEKPSEAVARRARITLGVAYREDHQPEKAAALLNELAKSPDGPESVDAQFLVGQGHYEAKRYAEAIAPLQQYLEGKGKRSFADHALALLAVCRLETGDAPAAWTDLARLEQSFPESKVLNGTRVRLGEAALAAGEYERAIQVFRPVAESKDDPALRVRALSGLGWAVLKDGKPADAAEIFETLLEFAPDDPLAPDAALARARALDDAGKTDAALAAYADVASKYPQSERAPAAALARARLLDRAGQDADAAAAFEQFLAEHPKSLPNEETADNILADWAWALVDADRADDADKIFNRLLEEHPESPRAADARVNLAESAYALKNLDEVEHLLDPVVAPGSKADAALVQLALFRLGRVKFDRKDWTAAAGLFGRLASDYPDGQYRRKALYWQAESTYQAGDAETAEKALATLLSSPKPAEPEDWLPGARLRRLQLLVHLARWDDALKEAASFKNDVPGFAQMAEVECSRGRALQGKARFDEAREAYQAVIDNRSAGTELAARAQILRGETYLHQKQYHEALKEFLRVDLGYEGAPKQKAAALLEAGNVYERLDQWAEAAEMYEKLRSSFPDDPNAAEAAKRLEAIRPRLAKESKSTEDAP